MQNVEGANGFGVEKLRIPPTPPAFCMNVKIKELINLQFVND
jgi:hypothetical protein